ncbi:hypothetical protein [Clostridium perfringens]|uniref:hypothetical protein n=1 Tax=Clostridium perfringens TaxID=1502 RepID=UPI0018E4214E|nr:hypothetical protein [Clostridium perfringens]MBI6057796.1 hypothetical protein [Clostridium perfringens]MDK0542366.1 hypothetical protein [Clostridium perfringens]MDK0678351.1 hypothetical protein [Clostridium perfringens]MDK0704685.1 hypothetical protein [Clostridium perfringens]MDK0785841.1 hypothetical protein [Clostridium perfringens]
MEISNVTINTIDEHMANIRQLMNCLDKSEQKFKEQLTDEYRYFDTLKIYVRKNKEIPDNLILILEGKLQNYKKTNKYRYSVAKTVIDYNKYIVENLGEFPF